MDRPALATIPPPRLGLRAQVLRRFLSLSLAMVRLRGKGPSTRPGDDPHSGLDGDLGYILHRDDAPILFKLLEHLDQKMGGVLPAEVRIGYLAACSVFDLPPVDGKPRHSLHIGLPCFLVWSVDELSAVVAHEMAHLKLADAAFTQNVLRLANELRGARRPRWPMGMFAPRLARWAAAVCRDMEFRADAWSASCFRPETLAVALEKLLVVTPIFDLIVHQYDPDGEPDGNIYLQLDRAWNSLSAEGYLDFRRRFVSRSRSDPYDAHPSIASRLIRLASVRNRELPPRARSAPAAQLVRNIADVKSMLHRRLFQLGKQAAAASIFVPADEEN